MLQRPVQYSIKEAKYFWWSLEVCHLGSKKNILANASGLAPEKNDG
jgi:hypothetical protein